MYVKRDLEDAILKHLTSGDDQFILLSGARQTGKTSLLENLAVNKKKLFINLWDETEKIQLLRNAATFNEFERYLEVLYSFTPDNSQLLIIDEAQGSKHLGKFIMQMHREWKGQQVIFSGSLLSHLFTDSVPMPTGRVIEFVLRPFNFREFLRFFNKENYLSLLPREITTPIDNNIHTLMQKEFELYLTLGGLPGILTSFDKGGDYLLLFESLVNNFYRDADRYLVDEQTKRTRAVQYGSLLEHSLTSISRLVAFPSTNSSILSTDSPAYRETLPKLLEALKSWHLIYALPYEMRQNTTKRGYNSKKYLFDTGIMNFLLTRGAPLSRSTSSETAAQLFENGVCQELVSYAQSSRAVTAYKTNNKSTTEVDFVVKTAYGVFPFEVKLGQKTGAKSFFQMSAFLEDKQIDRGFIVYNGLPLQRKIQNKNFVFIPPYYLSQILSGFKNYLNRSHKNLYIGKGL